MEATNDIRKVIPNMVKLVLEKDITWESLESILIDMSSTHAKSKQVIKSLIHELKAIDEKYLNDITSIEIDALETENIVIKPDDFSKEVQGITDSDDSETDDANETFNSHKHEKVIENSEKEPEMESSKFQVDQIQNRDQTDTDSGKNEEVVEELENEFYVFIGEKGETNSMREAHDIIESAKNIHKSAKAFECSICCKTFTAKQNLKKHRQIHTGEKPFQCKICSKSFSRSSNLKAHETIHTGEKPFQCKSCSKYYTQFDNLKRHEMIHTGEKPFHCKSCPKSFVELHHMKLHENIHTGEKPFKCSTCSKCFTQATNLKTHERIHSGERPFKCKTCSKSFTTLANLIRHEMIHTGERPFNCKDCGKCFTQNSSLKKHQKTHII